MALKLAKSTFPVDHTAEDFQCFGPPAVKDGEFDGTMICDMGCFTQDGKDSNKYYSACVSQSKKNQKWYTYFEWGRTGAKNPQFQMIECNSKTEAEREYVKQLEDKNTKRGEWINHPTLGRLLQAKAGKDCYLVRPQATRSTGLPDARTIKMNEGAKPVPTKTTISIKPSVVCDTKTLALMRDLNVATVSYARGAMTDDSLPTQTAIDEGRDILSAVLNRIKVVGDDIDDQLKDKEITSLTSLMYGRIPKKKERNASPDSWLLTKNNILMWQQDLDVFESALNTTVSDVENKSDPFGGMNLKMEWLSPTSAIGEFIHYWAPKASRNKHGYLGNMQIKNVWSVERNEELNAFNKEQLGIKMPIRWNNEKPFHQPSDRPDLSVDENNLYKNTNTALLFHGTRSCNTTGILREGFRFPKELTNVFITGAMFSGGGAGVYGADDWRKSAGYTSLRNSYYSAGSGAVKGREAFMFICDFVLGVPHVAPGPHPYTKYPDGSHCIFGKAGVSQVQNNEWIILKKSQYRLRYLIEFVA